MPVSESWGVTACNNMSSTINRVNENSFLHGSRTLLAVTPYGYRRFILKTWPKIILKVARSWRKRLITVDSTFLLMESLIRHQSQRLRGGWIPERKECLTVSDDPRQLLDSKPWIMRTLTVRALSFFHMRTPGKHSRWNGFYVMGHPFQS